MPAAFADLTSILQAAITPVALISGVGLLLLSMSSRFASITSRARLLSRQMHRPENAGHPGLTAQVRILYRRSRILRAAMTLALASVLLVNLLVIALFVSYLTGLRLHPIEVSLFVLALVSLLASLGLFIHDITLSLRALKQELRPYL